MNNKYLTKDDLMSLEEYAERRPGYRDYVMTHKKHRQVALGPNARLYFEDRITMQYQIQEILRIEKIFETQAINEEMDVYNPLIPDGSNWKATFMIEYENENERRQALSKLIGIERKIWVQVGDSGRVNAIANEDLVRETSEKTSAVHFLRFELTPEMIAAAKTRSEIRIGVEHQNYSYETGALPDNISDSLVGDLMLHCH